MRILGIDPGYAIVGYAVLVYGSNRFAPVGIGHISTKEGVPFTSRLNDIYEDMVALIDTYQPEQLAIEELFSNTNVKTVIKVGQARGVILLAAEQHDISVFEYTPLQIKTVVTGYGKAKKPQVMEMTRRLLKLEKVPKPDDTADALAVALCHIQANGSGIRRILSQGRY